MRDFLLGLAFMISGAVVIGVARGYPTMASLQYGPSLFPTLIGAGMVGGGALLALWHLPPLKRASAAPVTHAGGYDYKSLLMSLVPGALIVFYILAGETLGAPLCMLLAMLVLMHLRGVRLRTSLPVASVAALAIYWLFSRYLLIPLPEGTLMPW